MTQPAINILLIEDDEDDFLIIRDLLRQVRAPAVRLEWVPDYGSALRMIKDRGYDVVLLDYRLGDHNGIELLEEAIAGGLTVPIILLTGHGDYEIDLSAMRAGATDYLIKSEINPPLLERAIRYAMARGRAESALRESEQELRRLSARLMRVQEDERRRISRELHDELGQSLSLLKLYIRGIERKLDNGQVSLLVECRQALAHIDGVIEDVRRLARDLSPSILEDLGLSATLRWMTGEFAKQSGVHVILESPDIDDCLPSTSQIIVYRLFQEIFTNIGKHAGASQVVVDIRRTPASLEFLVEDNGVGFRKDPAPPGVASQGLGLTTMAERVRMLGGRLAVISSPGDGTRVRFQLPHGAGATTGDEIGALPDELQDLTC